MGKLLGPLCIMSQQLVTMGVHHPMCRLPRTRHLFVVTRRCQLMSSVSYSVMNRLSISNDDHQECTVQSGEDHSCQCCGHTWYCLSRQCVSTNHLHHARVLLGPAKSHNPSPLKCVGSAETSRLTQCHL